MKYESFHILRILSWDLDVGREVVKKPCNQIVIVRIPLTALNKKAKFDFNDFNAQIKKKLGKH